ncbi:unnamed protein product, partial [Schistosoma mattheei]
MVVEGSRQETLDPGFVLGVSVILRTGASWRIRSRVTQFH